MATATFNLDIPAISTTHLVFQPSIGMTGSIITQSNTGGIYEKGLEYGSGSFSFYEDATADSYTINIDTSKYIYYHLVMQTATTKLYGIEEVKGTAQSTISSTTVKLSASDTQADDYYNGYTIHYNGEVRVITDYVSSTKIATVSAWTNTPVGSLPYRIIATTGVLLKSFAPSGMTGGETNSLVLYSDCKYLYLWVDGKEQTSDEITATLAYNFKPNWTGTTKLFAPFNNSLSAGITQSLDTWNVYKTKSGDSFDSLVGIVPVEQKILVDYAIPINQTYKYKIFPTSPTLTAQAIESNDVIIDSWSYSLTDTITKQVFLFDLDVSSTGSTHEIDRTEYQSFAEKNKVAYGKTRFVRDGLSATFGYISDDGTFNGNLTDYQKLEAFFATRTPKLYKDREGSLLVVDCYNLKKKIDDKSIEQIKTVTFDIMEIGDINNYHIYE